MASRARTALIAFVLVAPAAVGFVVLRNQNAEEIERVQVQLASVTRERDSTRAIVTANAVIQRELEQQRDAANADAAQLRSTVDSLEQERRQRQLTVRRIRRSSDLSARLESTFPELSAANWGVTSIPIEEGDTLSVEYFLIPVWFTETFIIDHLNAESWRLQKDRLLEVDSLRLQVASLQDSIIRLHIVNANALQTGYDNCQGQFLTLSERYIASLRKPSFSVGSTAAMCGGAAALGVFTGLIINE